MRQKEMIGYRRFDCFGEPEQLLRQCSAPISVSGFSLRSPETQPALEVRGEYDSELMVETEDSKIAGKMHIKGSRPAPAFVSLNFQIPGLTSDIRRSNDSNNLIQT